MADREQADGTNVPQERTPETEQPRGPEDVAAEQAGARALADALKGSFRVLKVAMIALAVFYVISGIFYVQPQEVRFKLRFGRVVPSWGEWALQPGTMHIQWPWEAVERVSTEERSLAVETEFWTQYPMGPAPTRKSALRVQEDGFLITGDANIVHMQVRARYRVRGDAPGALSYLFGVTDAEEILKRQLLGATVKVVGSMKVMDVLKRQALLDQIRLELQRRVAVFEARAGIPLGIRVEAVEASEVIDNAIKNPTEPLAVRQAFTDAQNASSLRQQLIDEGRIESIAILEDARAKAAEIVASAAGFKERLVQTAQADAEAMAKLLPVYQASSEEAAILRETFFQRTLNSVMDTARSVYILYENPDRELRLLLSAEPPPPTED
ncbi:MAG: hypothetical protein GXY85_09775 [Candidatus Brocadiaceae bacterium]|nr:hypothetical protein [Candidatus Brocadiaceae bacterium]